MQWIIRSGLGLVGLFLGITLVGACGGDEDLSLGNGCTPGISQACVGPGACNGFQVCAPDGKGFTACDCGAGTGGGGGSAQASVSSAGTGGAGQGGATATTTTTGQGGAGQGGAGQGGMGTGGMGATTTSSTGTGGNPVDCTPMEPMSGDPCMTPVTGCIYNDQHCECFPLGGNQTWDCDTCPAQEPTTGDTCTSSGFTDIPHCFYGPSQCACIPGGGGTSTWQCGTCPAQAPMNMDPCTENGVHCVYANTACNCFGFGGTMNWTCN